MADERLEKELSLARRAAPVFGLGRQQQVVWGGRRRLRGEPSKARLLGSLLAAACLVGTLAVAVLRLRSDTVEIVSAATKDEHWQLRDGSQIVLETPATRITKERESSEEVLFELAAGAARFDVAHRPERAFRVQAGPVQVSVIGTRFRVERRGERTLVAVERGRVLVSWGHASSELRAGEKGVFPPRETAERAADRSEPSTDAGGHT